MTNSPADLCPLCGGNKEPGKITFTADLGTGLVVVRRVSATVCTQCGEEWVDDATAQRLEDVPRFEDVLTFARGRLLSRELKRRGIGAVTYQAKGTRDFYIGTPRRSCAAGRRRNGTASLRTRTSRGT